MLLKTISAVSFLFLFLDISMATPTVEVTHLEQADAGFFQPEVKRDSECQSLRAGPKKVKIKIGYSYVQNIVSGSCNKLSSSQKDTVQGALLYAGDDESRLSFVRETMEGNELLLSCFDQKALEAKEFNEVSNSVREGDAKTINTLIRKNSINRWTPQLLNMGFKTINKDTLVLNVDFLNSGKRIIGFIPVGGIDSTNLKISTGALLIWASIEGEDFITVGQAAKLKVKASDISVEFSGFLGAHFIDSSKANEFSDLSSTDESFSLIRGDRLALGVLSLGGPLAALKAKLNAEISENLTSDLETRFQILNNDRGTFYRNDFRGRLLFSAAEDVTLFLKQREINGASFDGDVIQRNSVTAGGIIITPYKENSSGGYGSFSFSGISENIKDRTAMLGELKLGAKSRDGSKASLLVRGGLSEESSGDYSVYGSLLGRLSLSLVDNLSLGLDGRIQTGRTPMQFRDGMMSDNEEYPFSRPFWFTGISLKVDR